MHSIEFISVAWQNLLSYGSNINEISLNNKGITWIKGENGAGKSTIIEALTVALFGESYRKIPQKELPNTANKGKLWVRLIFDRIDVNGKVRYIIKRELGKSGSMSMTLSILDEVEQVEKKPAGVSQKLFEDDILGFNKNLFENVISWNSIQTKSFIDMTSEEKRKLIESIIALHIDKIKKMNSVDSNLYSSKFNDAANDVIKFRNRIQDLEVSKQTLLREQQDDIDQLELDIKNTQSSIDVLNEQLTTLKTTEKTIIKTGTDIKSKYESYGSPDNTLMELVEYTSLLSNDDDNSSEITRLTSIIESANTSINTINNVIESLNLQLKELPLFDGCVNVQQMQKKLVDMNASVSYLTGTIKTKQDELDHVKAENDALATGVPCSLCGKPSTEDDIETVRKTLRDKWKTINNSKKKCESDLIEINKNIETISKLITDHVSIVTELDKKKNELTPFINDKKQTTATIDSINSRTKIKTDRINKLRTLLGDPSDINALKIKLEADVVLKSSTLNELNNMRTELSLNKTNQLNLSKQIESLNKSIDALIQRLNKRRTIDTTSSVAINESQLQKANDDLIEAMNNVTQYSDDNEIIKFIDEMYGDEGIKKFILGMFVPTLNQAIGDNISSFALPFMIEFDDSLSHNFVGKFGMAQTYNALSQGQKRKLNFCISMAFSDFVGLIADFKINIMFLDEVLDVSTDHNSLREMIGLVKIKNKDIPSIYLMSHRGEDFEDDWDHVIAVSSDGMYSKAEQIR